MKCLALFSFLLMVGVNALANILRINGVTTAEVSEAYPNLFAPAGYAFSIWGMIYTLLVALVLYQLGLFHSDNKKGEEDLIKKIRIYFILSSLANTAWVFAWHYDLIGLSVILIATMLWSLIMMAVGLRGKKLTKEENAFVKWPVALYFGWVTVALIANVTVYLVSIGWDGLGVSADWWMVIMLVVGALIGMATMWWFKSLIYGSVIVWAYIAIYVKHTSMDGWAGEYPLVIGAVIMCIIFCLVMMGWRWKKGLN